jgi:hypothetical protein
MPTFLKKVHLRSFLKIHVYQQGLVQKFLKFVKILNLIAGLAEKTKQNIRGQNLNLNFFES